MFSLYIFDLDGTLIDSRKDIANAVNRTFRDLNLPELPNATIYGYVGNGVYRLITDATKSTDPTLLNQALKIFEGHYLAHLVDETCLYPGMGELLFQYQHKRKAVVTNKRIKFTQKIIERLCPENTFALVLGAQEGVNLKPHPEMILKTIAQLNVPANETVLIGDMMNDIHAARAAGIKVCAVSYGFGDEKELQEGKPDFFARTVNELKVLFQ
ncbi:MAG: HAD-IA family hydrolase [Nitrospirae bacterium]|nr:HAD-IA family hydrolase [Candidatus Troglogloeales bacterium]